MWSMTDSVLLYIRSISHQFFLGSLCCMLKYSPPGTTKAVQPLDYISGHHFHSNQTVKQASFDLRYKPVHFKEKCIESIIEKCGCIIKGKRRRLSLSSASTPHLSAVENAHILLNKSPGGRGRTGSRGTRGRSSLSAPSRSPSVKRGSQSTQFKETKIPKVSA